MVVYFKIKVFFIGVFSELYVLCCLCFPNINLNCCKCHLLGYILPKKLLARAQSSSVFLVCKFLSAGNSSITKSSRYSAVLGFSLWTHFLIPPTLFHYCLVLFSSQIFSRLFPSLHVGLSGLRALSRN